VDTLELKVLYGNNSKVIVIAEAKDGKFYMAEHSYFRAIYVNVGG
jgi:hypothetical protein